MGQQPDTRVEEGRPVTSDIPSPSEQGQSSLRRLSNSPTWNGGAPSPKSYPPMSSVPRTSRERLALAPADDPSASADTILYLAYGSNMCAETFLGVRGIRPISCVNVSAPAFDLTFDLPGIPYSEPCFANTRPRKIPGLPVPGKPPKFPPHSSSTSGSGDDDDDDDDDDDSNDDDDDGALPPGPPAKTPPTWTKGLYGVVYEVTPEDYATIIKTEGGGQGYHDVLTPCFELPPAMHVPEKPHFPELPGKPFLAHTLFAPSWPDDDDGDDDGGDDPAKPDGEGDEPRKKKEKKKLPWFRRLFLPVRRPDGDYAEASARYLKLIRDGAREHALPEAYRAYLASLEPYAATTARQRAGRVAFIAVALPLLLPVLALGRLLADPRGRTPRWLGLATNAAMNVLWAAYDVVFKPVFGDGERTVGEREGEKEMRMRKMRMAVLSSSSMGGTSGEKNGLLSDW